METLELQWWSLSLHDFVSLSMQDSLKFADLYLYLSEAAPFGTPVDINANNVRLHLKGKVPGTAANQGEKVSRVLPMCSPDCPGYNVHSASCHQVVEQISATLIPPLFTIHQRFYSSTFTYIIYFPLPAL